MDSRAEQKAVNLSMKKCLLIIALAIFSISGHAQKNYAVKIADSKTEAPLNNATVIIKSTNKKAVTNESGLLVIQSEPGQVLAVSRPGYKSQEATLSASSSVQVFLVKKPAKKKSKQKADKN